jgi:hypothetical protein
MTSQAWLTLVMYVVALIVLAYPLGVLMARLVDGAPSRGVIGRLESMLYRLCGVDPARDMPWTEYAVALLLFNALGVLVVFGLQRLQLWLPLNPQAFANVSPDSAFDSAVSFVTNTNWQGYAGESTMSYLTQMLGFAVQNFFSAATGIAVAFALIRGFARRSARGIGNFWVDLTRSTVYVLLPLSTVLAVVFMAQGVIQNFDASKEVTTVESLSYANPKLDSNGQSRDRTCDDSVADAAHGTGGLAGGHQNARNQWRRIFQRQFRSSLRESDAADELSPDDLHVSHSGRTVFRLWPSRGRLASGMGNSRGDDGHLCRDGGGCHVG